MRGAVVGLAVAGAAIVAVAVVWWRAEEPSHATTSAPATPRSSPSTIATSEPPSWPRGGVWYWQIEWASSASLFVDQGESPTRFEGTSRVEGVLRARSLGELEGRHAVVFALVEASLVDVSLNGAPAQSPDAVRASLVGHEWLGLFSREGALEALRVDDDASPLFASFAQSVLGDAQVVVRDGSAWSVSERSARGLSDAHYTREDELLRRTRVEYRELVGMGAAEPERTQSEATASIVSSGGWGSIESTERVTARTPNGRTQVAATHLVLRPTSGPALDAADDRALLTNMTDVLAPGDLVEPRDAREQMLAQRVDGLSEEELLEGIVTHARAGMVADQHRFALRASGLLLARPELCATLAEHVTREESDERARSFALQLLVGAGSEAAQAAMRAILSAETTRARGEHERLVLLVALVERPTRETVDFAVTHHAQTRGAARLDAALVVGSVAGQFERQTDEPQPSLDALGESLASARGDVERVATLRAFGNAGVERLTRIALERTTDPSASVRAAVSDAVRKTPSPETRAALERLARDHHPGVQRAAITTLAGWPVEASTLAALGDQVERGELAPSSTNALVSLLAPLASTPEARSILQTLLARPVPDPSIHTRIRSLLGDAS